MKLLLQSILFIFPILSSAQKTPITYKVSYNQFSNGTKSETEASILYQDQIVSLSKPDDKIQHFTDLEEGENVSSITYENQKYLSVTSFTDLPQPNLDSSTDSLNERILDYECTYVSYSYFSNKIEVWYTEETVAKGSLYSRFLPSNKALVLKIVINENREIIANEISEVKSTSSLKNFANNAKKVSKAEFEEIKINSRYTKLVVFKEDTINYNPEIKVPIEKDLQSNRAYHFSNGSVLMKKIKLTEKLKNSGQVFAKLSCKSNGDAYDRTGSIFIIPAKKEGLLSILDAYLHGLDQLPVLDDHKGNQYQGIVKEGNYRPPIEILRFFTSFGVDHFNEKRKINNYTWAKDVIFKQEVSSLIPSDEDEIWVGVFIGNYDSGGHILSLDLDFHPSFAGEETEKSTKYIESLFSTVNTMEMSEQNYGKLFNNDTLRVNFELTENIENLQLLYTSTGHGGWGGGDEFNPKLNQLFIDGKEVFKIVPWRTDCGTYRLSNPASGNFENGLSSSDFSRSNWCPGALTPPYIIPLSHLKKGKHTLEVVIDQGEEEGSSFSHWSTSGILIGEIIESTNSSDE